MFFLKTVSSCNYKTLFSFGKFDLLDGWKIFFRESITSLFFEREKLAFRVSIRNLSFSRKSIISSNQVFFWRGVGGSEWGSQWYFFLRFLFLRDYKKLFKFFYFLNLNCARSLQIPLLFQFTFWIISFSLCHIYK